MIAQDPTKHPGSIIRINLMEVFQKIILNLRINLDWLPEIYQIGIRNPQGLTLSPFDKKIYMSNHGARGGDWFGEAKKGENYGWKILGGEEQIILVFQLVQNGNLVLQKQYIIGCLLSQQVQ